MEEISIHHLSQFITEELFLIQEDMEISAQIETGSSKSQEQPVLKQTNPIIPHSDQTISEEKVIIQELKEEPIPVLGNFEKGVLILIEEDSLRPEVMEMLVKMLNAVGHSMSEVGLIHSHTLDMRSMKDLKNLNAHTILKFGRIQHPINSLPANQYEVYSEKDVQYLFADALTGISEDNSLKKKLWGALQIIFNISK
jgi:hypothetical protein